MSSSTGTPQPTLSDGHVVLRAWRADDAEANRLQPDEELARWLGWGGIVATLEQMTAAIENRQRDYAADRRVVSFAVERDTQVVGAVEVRQRGDGVGEVSWTVHRDHRQDGLGLRALRLLVGYCFADLGLVRLLARVEVGNEASLRTAEAAGFRREGIARQEQTTLDHRADFVHLSRLAGDDTPDEQHSTRVPPQPTFRDGEVVLRPWTRADLEPARRQYDVEVAHLFGGSGVGPSAESQLAELEQWQTGYADGRRWVVYLVEHGGEVAGWVDVTQRGDGVGELSWGIFRTHRRQGVATRAVRMLVDYCFADLGLLRVEARVEVGNLGSLRTAGRAGLRREGVARGESVRPGRRPDLVHLARLAGDPTPYQREGFIGVLNAALPTKRVIAQGLVRNLRGDVLLCELTYKKEWDLPGGVVDPHESPSDALAREISEELGLTLPPRDLVLVNWMPPWRGWDDACLFVFDLGVHPDELIDGLTTEPREIAALHWCPVEEAEEHVAPYLAELLPRLVGSVGERPVYLEGGSPPDFADVWSGEITDGTA
jgi:RimJ/RimL family protein N-acetyltransferase/ADP-ribose pyrophosphatase YjhB (NUDIX family)